METLSEKEQKHFKTVEEKRLWIKLCAEYQIAWEKSLTYFDEKSNSYKPTMQALIPRSKEKAIEVAKNQLSYDIDHPEQYNGSLRVTLEEFLTLTTEEITNKEQKNFTEFWIPKFKNE